MKQRKNTMRKKPPDGGKFLVLNPGYRSHYDENGHNKVLNLNEELRHCFQQGDELVVLARKEKELGFDDDIPDSLPLSLNEQGFLSQEDYKREVPKETVLLLGTSRKAEKIAELLPAYLPDHSEVYCQVSEPKNKKGDTKFLPIPTLKTSEHYDIFDALSKLKANTHFTRRVVVSDAQDREHHDANILMTLTALHAATDDTIDQQAHTIFEIIDRQNQQLADTFQLKNRKIASLLSTEMVSDYLIQLANEPKRGRVYQELLDRLGNEIYFDDYERYIRMIAHEADGTQRKPSYQELERMARKRGRVVIGLHGKKYMNAASETYTMLSPAFGHGKRSKRNGEQYSTGLDGLYFDRPLPLENGTAPKGVSKENARRTVSHVIVVGPGPL